MSIKYDNEDHYGKQIFDSFSESFDHFDAAPAPAAALITSGSSLDLQHCYLLNEAGFLVTLQK
jgi:hypothetical protein